MKSVVAAAAILGLALASPARAALAVGVTAPELSAPAADGGKVATVVLGELLKHGPVVIYFFPSAFTETTGAQQFAENIDRFRAAGVNVVAVSRDTVDTLTGFAVQQCAGKFPVISADEALVNAFEVNDGAMFNSRTTYVVLPSGKIAFVHDDDNPAEHAKRALAFVEGIRK